MSIGRPDPNAFKVIPPDVYNQNLAEIARAKATLEAFEEMNEAGKSNYDRIVEQEERELEQKIREGLLAKQRLQEIRNRKAHGLLGNSSRIEEVGSANASGYDPVRHTGHSPVAASTSFAPPAQNAYTPHSQGNAPTVANNPQTASHYPPQYAPLGQVPYGSNQNPSTAYNGRPVQPISQSGSAQRSNFNPTYYPPAAPVQSNNIQGHLDTSNNNQFQPAQAAGGHYRQHAQTGPVYNPNTPNQTENSSYPSHSSIVNPHTQRQSFSEMHYRQVPHTNNGTSSLTGALGAVDSSDLPSAATSKPTMSQNAPSTIPPIASSSRSANSKDERFQSTASGTQAAAEFTIPTQLIIPTHPTREQVAFFKNHLGQWAARSPPKSQYPAPIICGKYTINCLKHADGSVRFIFNLQSGNAHMLASKFLDGLSSSVAKPVDHPPLEEQANISEPQLSANQARTVEQASTSATSNQVQAVSAPASATQKEPSSSSVPGAASVSTPRTPVQKAPLERRVGTITSPQQADKKRIAQSVLFALGKRRRENDNLPEAASQVFKKQALATTVSGKPQNAPSNVESSIGDSVTGISVEPKLTNTVLPEASTSVSTPTSLSQPLPQNDVLPVIVVPSVVPNVPGSSENPSHYPHQPYGQSWSTNSFSTHAPKQYVNFTPLNYNSARKASPVLAPPSVVPPPVIPEKTLDTAKAPSTNQSQIPISLDSEKKTNLSVVGQNPSSSTNTNVTASSSSVATTSKSTFLDNNCSSSTSGSVSVERKSSASQVPLVSAHSSSSVAKSTVAVSNTSDRAGNLIPEIAYLETQSSMPVASSSKLLPPKEPLFLPSSPSAEPETNLWAAEAAGTNVNEIDDTHHKKLVPRPIVNRAYVLVPPPPEYLIQYRQQKQNRAESRPSSSSAGGRRRNGTWTDSSETTPFGEEDFSIYVESQPVSELEEHERQAIQLSCSRLEATPCRWDGCEAEMNSVEALIRHLNTHKPTATQQTKTFMCRWKQCGQQGIKLEDVHLEKHALLPLRCAYLGCDHTFRSASQLLRHFRTRHSGDELKPSAKLAPPSSLPDPPPIPGTIPSYLIVTSLAGREVLSKERHSIIGPQVLRGMTSQQNGPTRRSRKNARPASPALPIPRTDLTNDYYFLENNNSARSSTYSSKAADLEHSDLDTESITKIVEQGILLLGSDGGITEEEVDDDKTGSMTPPSSPLQRHESRGEVEVKSGLESEPGGIDSSMRQDEHSSDEDAAVETMLTDVTSMRTSVS